jgi:hypothetical protein
MRVWAMGAVAEIGDHGELDDIGGLVGMTLRIYRPGEPWPTKKLPSHFRKAVEQAQAAGWSLHHHGADHWWGTLVCPAGEDDLHVHTFKVDATARGSTFWAQEASKTVTTKCRHGTVVPGSKVRSRRAECERLLDRAEQLLDKVSDGLDQAERYQAAVAVLDQLDLQLEAAEATVREALAEELAQAEAAALQAVYDTSQVPRVAELAADLGAAESAVGESNSVAAQLGRNRENLARPLVERGSACLERSERLRTRLGGLTSAG